MCHFLSLSSKHKSKVSHTLLFASLVSLPLLFVFGFVYNMCVSDHNSFPQCHFNNQLLWRGTFCSVKTNEKEAQNNLGLKIQIKFGLWKWSWYVSLFTDRVRKGCLVAGGNRRHIWRQGENSDCMSFESWSSHNVHSFNKKANLKRKQIIITGTVNNNSLSREHEWSDLNKSRLIDFHLLCWLRPIMLLQDTIKLHLLLFVVVSPYCVIYTWPLISGLAYSLYWNELN